MKILIAPDKFKSSLTSEEACRAIRDGIKSTFPGSQLYTFPLADGGEGTSDILLFHMKGKKVNVNVHDPLFRIISAEYGLSSDGLTAFIDMSKASGLHLLNAQEKNVMRTTTLGTGELIRDAIDKGVKNIILGIGGSATNDAAIGAASALGFEFFSEENKSLLPVGEELVQMRKITTTNVHPCLREVTFTAICDVDNPLTGEKGAAHVYAPQKGATPEQVTMLDKGLKNFAGVVYECLHKEIEHIPGSGAGGGFGGGAIAFFNARLKRGVEVVIELTGFEKQLAEADVIITGEGKIDAQTLHGKLVEGISNLARKYKKKLIVIAGKNELSEHALANTGIDKIFALSDYVSEEQSMKNAFDVLQRISAQHVAKYVTNLNDPT